MFGPHLLVSFPCLPTSNLQADGAGDSGDGDSGDGISDNGDGGCYNGQSCDREMMMVILVLVTVVVMSVVSK